MASVLTRHATRNLRKNTQLRPRRAIHMSSIVFKKKEASSAILELDFDEDLFSEKPKAQMQTKEGEYYMSTTFKSPHSTPNATQSNLSPKTLHKLIPAERTKRFEDILTFIRPRVGRHPSLKHPKVRNSAWVHLIDLATTEEQMKKVVELFPLWTDGGRDWGDGYISELFVRRCEQLSCPTLALSVFGTYSKYGLPLTLPSARTLLHSLHSLPLSDTIAASALYSLYSLPPVSGDLISCALFLQACLKDGSADALKVADEMVERLKPLVKRVKDVKTLGEVARGVTGKEVKRGEDVIKLRFPTQPASAPETKGIEPSWDEKPYVWVKWALRKVDRYLAVKVAETEDEKAIDWLNKWRRRQGHILPGKAL